MYKIWNVESAKEVGRATYRKAVRMADMLELRSGEMHIVVRA